MDGDPFDLIGDVLDGQFRVDAFAGEGDLSVVYKGHHLGLDAPVAIKCLNLPATLDGALVRPLVDSFKEAGRVHYRLARRNLNIAQSIASGSTLAPRTGVLVPYLVREWFEGESLASDLERRRRERRGGRSAEEVRALLEPVLDAVALAHRDGESHLSLNPSNLFLAKRSDRLGSSLKVLDFGVGRTMNDLVPGIAGPSGSGGGLRVLFPAYAAPEQLDKKFGAVGPWTDVYALALIAMELLSDRLVMSETETGALVEHALDAARRPTPRAHGLKLPPVMDRALERAVSLEPARRQRDAAELWRDLTTASTQLQEAAALLRPRAATLVGMAAPVPARVAGAVGYAKTPSLGATKTQQFSFSAASAALAASAPARASFPIPAPEAPRLPAPFPPPLPASVLAAPPVLGPPPALAPAPALAPVMAPEPVLVPASPPAVEPAPVFSPVAAPLDPGMMRDPQPPAFPAASSDFSLTVEPARHPLARLQSSVWFARLRTLRRLPVRQRVALGAMSAVLLLLLAALLHSPRQEAAAATLAAQHPPSPPLPDPPPVEPPESPPPVRFSHAAAWRAVFAMSREVTQCRRSSLWGGGTATVTFANDGSVSDVAFRPPFRGSATAACVADVFETVRVAPYDGKRGAVDIWFYVAQWPSRSSRSPGQ
jgi:hypothetical protein